MAAACELDSAYHLADNRRLRRMAPVSDVYSSRNLTFHDRHTKTWLGECGTLAALLCGTSSIAQATDDTVRFNRDIRPAAV